MKRLFSPVPPLLLAGCLTGCLQGSGSFPSLQPRPYEVDPGRVAERPDDQPEPPRAPVVTPLSYEQRVEVEAAQDRHRAADAAFRGALPSVRGAVAAAAGSAPGGEAWVVAQQALSRLEAARTPSAEALADLDRLLTERLAQEQQGAAAGGAEDIVTARAVIEAAVRDQSMILSGLARRIG